jgi:hypothetical protein
MRIFPINNIIKWYLRQRVQRINYAIDNPVETQEIVFNKLISAASQTEWGRKHHYHSIKHYKDFASRVPLQDYETIKPFIERMMKGEQNVLWHSDIKWFAKSSGTTSDKSKFIPVSAESLNDCHYKAGKDTMALYVEQYPDTEIFSGKGLVMGGSNKTSKLNDAIRFGDVSAVMLQNIPLLGSFLKTPPSEIALLDDWEEKIEKTIEITLKENVTHLVGVPTWTLVLLKEMLLRTGKKYADEIWQHLELYIHGGVSFTPYQNQFRKIIASENMRYMETYNASEGFFGLQNDLTDKNMALMPDYGIFFEFIPAENADDDNPPVISLEAVEMEKNYAMVISTNGGLWRYKIGDTITFTSRYPFKFIISGRTKHFINAFGEEVMVDNTDKAIALACEKTGSVVKDYTAAPVYMSSGDKGCHEWLIEFEILPSNLENFTAELDNALQSLNSDYEAKRYKDIALSAPRIHVMSENTFYNWLKRKGKLGGQNKVPRLSNDRKLVEDILKTTNE